MSVRSVKREILSLLESDDFERFIVEMHAISGPELLNPLFSAICNCKELTRWHAITAIGIVVTEIANHDMEAARVIMRRFMWSLNDESGGIGWGAPEAMAEIMARHHGLAGEYSHILVSFMREDGFFLEFEPLQRGLMWGLGRLAQARPDLLLSKDVVRYLLPYLNSDDGTVRGLAAWCIGFLKAGEAIPLLEGLLHDTAGVRLYNQGKFIDTTVSEMARQSLAAITA